MTTGFRAVLAAHFALVILAAPFAGAQNNRAAAADIFHKKFFVSYQAATLSNVAVSYEFNGANNPPGDVEKLKGTGGKAFGAGFSILGRDKFLFQVAYDRAAATFATWLDPDRTIAFHSIDFTFGYAFPGRVVLVPYGTVGLGWYRQSSWNDPRDFSVNEDVHRSFYEAMQGNDYTVSAAFGAKVGFLRYFALTGEVRSYFEDTGGGACGGNPNCIDLTDRPKPKDYALRTSVGLQVYVWRLGKGAK
jgi:hypothetical protein